MDGVKFMTQYDQLLSW